MAQARRKLDPCVCVFGIQIVQQVIELAQQFQFKTQKVW